MIPIIANDRMRVSRWIPPVLSVFPVIGEQIACVSAYGGRQYRSSHQLEDAPVDMWPDAGAADAFWRMSSPAKGLERVDHATIVMVASVPVRQDHQFSARG